MISFRQVSLSLAAVAAFLMLAVPVGAQEADTDAMIASAVSAGPASISADATVMDWSMNVLREGSNGWTCLPDDPDADGNSPWCADGAWMNFIEALVSGSEPTYEGMGVAYMLMGDSPICNSDFFASQEECGEGDWVTGLGAHMMLLVSDASMLEGMSADHMNGGPWVMFPGSSFAHVMVPIEDR